MKTSESLTDLATALSKAQAKIEAARKDTANPFFKSKYADLASVWASCRGPLSENGLSVVQGFENIEPIIHVGSDGVPKLLATNNTVRIVTKLLHVSGQWVESTLDLTPKDNSPQSVGSAITYGRRYSLGAIVGVVTDVDDDGNAASDAKPSYPAYNPKK